MQNLTDEQIKDIQDRIDQWAKKGEELQLVVKAIPQLVENEKGNFEMIARVIIGDTKYSEQVASPFVK